MGAETVAERFHRARRDPELVVLEGFHALKHAVRFGAAVVEIASRDPGAVGRVAAALAPDVASVLEGAGVVDAATFARLSPRPHPTGVIAIARRPRIRLETLGDDAGPAPIILLEEPRRPGNVGAVVRVAAAAGAAGVLALGGVDPWDPVAVRGGAGLQFALPVARVTREGLSREPGGWAGGRPLVALDPGGTPLTAGGIPPPAILAFGTERAGLTPDLLGRADLRLAIPMRPGVSSLNLATAAAVTLYTWRLTPG
jgi:TrmH family RNA methyltransferase